MTEMFWIWQKKKVGETPLRDLQLWSFCEEEEDGCSDSTAELNHDHQSAADGYSSYPEEGFGTPGGLLLLKVGRVRNGCSSVQQLHCCLFLTIFPLV